MPKSLTKMRFSVLSQDYVAHSWTLFPNQVTSESD